MRLLSLDFDPVYGEDATRTQFAGDISAFDYDVVIWDPEPSLEFYTRYSSTYQGEPALSDDRSVTIKADAARRRKEFKEFIEAGRTLIVVVSSPQLCYVATGTRDFSGTGRNRVTTRHVELFDLLTASLPIDDPQFMRARGDRIEIDGDGPLHRLLRKYSGFYYYRAVMAAPVGTAIAKVATTSRYVASIQASKGGGHIIMLPAMAFEAEYDEEDDAAGSANWVEEAPQFQSDLLQAIGELTGGTALSRPVWAGNYATQKQIELRNQVTKQQKSVEAARTKLAKSQKDLERAEVVDQLFLGSGRVLELEVKAVLELLGGDVTDPEPGRDDWKVAFGDKKAVVEVKGVAKSAAEKHAAQLEKWVAAEFEQSGQQPKGILVVNTFRDTPLADRNNADFPDQMLPYSTSRGHCLLTGLDLFVIRAEIEADAEKAALWREKILATNGRLADVPDWKQHIQTSSDTIEDA